jgi:hypothetical protein
MKTVFVRIGPEGFTWPGNRRTELRMRIHREQEARKLWTKRDNRRELACHSADGVRSREGQSCAACPRRDSCQPRLRLYFRQDGQDFCLELPASSRDNYREYREGLLESGLAPDALVTLARVAGRGYWGEVTFTPDV